MAAVLPLGNIIAAKLTVPNLTTHQVDSPDAFLRLGGNTKANDASSFLNLECKPDGVHLTEPSVGRMWLDTPATFTDHLNATAGISVSQTASISSLAVSGVSNLTGLVTTSDLKVMGSLTVMGVTATVAVSNNGPQDDSLADGAGVVIATGTSGSARSILWHYNQGIDYKSASSDASTDDGRSYFEFQGGNMVLTRLIPAANHVAWDFTRNMFVPDNVATKVSYRFAIGDDEKLNIAKCNGANYPAGAGSLIGGTAPLVATFELPVAPLDTDWFDANAAHNQSSSPSGSGAGQQSTEPVCFRLYSNTTQQYNAPDCIGVGGVIDFDTNSGLSNTTGLYTVPSSGFYHLTWKVQIVPSTNDAVPIQFGINGQFKQDAQSLADFLDTNIVWIRIDNGNVAFPATHSILRKLTAGDTVGVYVGPYYGGSFYAYEFSGFRLS